MKIPTFLLKKKPAKKTLRASTARRSLSGGDEMDFDEMSEPNMKLSRALLIVLVLHVVAVAGIVAFNTIKSRQGVLPPPPLATTTTAPKTDNAPSAAARMDAAASAAPIATAAPVIVAKQGPAGEVRKAEPVKPLASAVPINDGKSYVVAKGDNPVKIAKKLKVSEAELLAANHIDDPRKLQIGQKLIVPASKSPKTKKSEE